MPDILDDSLRTLAEILLPVLITMLTAGAPLLMKRLWDVLGVERDSQLRPAVEQALQNGIRRALAKHGIQSLEGLDGQWHDLIASEAAEYAKRTVPTSLRKLKVRSDNLPELARARMAVLPTPLPNPLRQRPAA